MIEIQNLDFGYKATPVLKNITAFWAKTGLEKPRCLN